MGHPHLQGIRKAQIHAQQECREEYTRGEWRMKYKLDFSPKVNVSSPPVTGAVVSASLQPVFVAWQPSTWPAVPSAVDEKFIYTLKRIFEDSILGEISNVIADVRKSNGDLQHRG